MLLPRQVCAQIGCGDPRHLPVSVSAGFQALARLLDAAYRSLDFYSGQMRGLSDVEKLCSEQCSVCLTPMDDVEALVMLPCAHIFHRECVREVLETNPKCPYCRTHAPRKSMSSVVLEAGADFFKRFERLLPGVLMYLKFYLVVPAEVLEI